MISQLESIHSIELKNVSYTYQNGQLFDDVSISFEPNNFYMFSGYRESGKSTLLKILANTILPDSGQVLFNGNDTSELSFEEQKKYRLGIGYSFDYGGLINSITVFENLALPLRYHNIANDDEISNRVNALLSMFNLSLIKDKRPPDVSGGIKKELCVLRSLVLNPEVLILDSPTVGVSSVNSIKLQVDLLKKMEDKRLKYIFCVSDNINFYSEFDPIIINLEQKKLNRVGDEMKLKVVTGDG